VNKDIKFTNERTRFNAQASSRFPDALNTSSPLYQESVRIFNDEMDKQEQATSSGPYNAILKAASNLGIAPVDLAQVKANEARNETGEGPGSSVKEDKALIQKRNNFAKGFGVSEEKFNEKLKLVAAKTLA